jgi:polar amino acid transport system substrate-binding protein
MPDVRGTILGLLLLMLFAVAFAQYPPVPRDLLHGPPSGRRLSGDSITFCVDPRDPGHAVDEEVARAIAGALLLKPEFHTIERTFVSEDIENVYVDLVNECHVYLGFKLLPGAYPNWLTPTSAYYLASYVMAVDDPSWEAIGDIPRSMAVGGVPGSPGDIRLLTYINALPPDERWARYPQGSHERALQAVLDGELGGALVWAPAFWELKGAHPAFADLRTFLVPGVSEGIGVCGVILSGNPFLRSALDDAITAITQDGTVAGILAHFDYPARPATP